MLCIGLDLVNKNFENYKTLIDDTNSYCDFFKLNPAFINDQQLLYRIASYLGSKNIPWIYDGKIGDVLHTNKEYANYIYGILKATGTTLNPYVGFESLNPFLEYENKHNFILCKTSNCEDKQIQNHAWQLIAKYAHATGCGLVVAGNNLDYIKQVRELNPKSLILAPGIGAQGGEINEGMKNVIFSVSRSVINSRDPRFAAMKYRQQLYPFLLRLLDKNKCITEGRPLTLSSGQKSNIYYDLRKAAGIPDVFRYIVHELKKIVPPNCSIVSVPTGGMPYGAALAYELQRPFGYVRTGTRDHGLKKRIEGVIDQNSAVVLIEDVVTSGKSVDNALKILTDNNVNVAKTVCIINRSNRNFDSIVDLGNI